VLGLSFAPFGLRAFRLVILYDTAYRLKYARFVKWKVITRAWVAVAGAIGIYAMVIFVCLKETRYARYVSNASDCFDHWSERWFSVLPRLRQSSTIINNNSRNASLPVVFFTLSDRLVKGKTDRRNSEKSRGA